MVNHRHARDRRPCCRTLRKSTCLFRVVKEGLLATNRHCEALAAFSATARQYILTIFCGHSSTETVSRFTSAIARLICTFHRSSPYDWIQYGIQPTERLISNGQRVPFKSFLLALKAFHEAIEVLRLIMSVLVVKSRPGTLYVPL